MLPAVGAYCEPSAAGYPLRPAAGPLLLLALMKSSRLGLVSSPYQTPMSAGPEAFGPSAPIDVGRAFSDGWAVFSRHLGVLVGATVVGLLLTILSVFTVVGLFLAAPVIVWGMTRLTLNAIDGTPDFNDLFAGFQRYQDALLNALGFLFVVFLLSLPSTALSFIGRVSEEPSLLFLSFIIGILVSCLVSFRIAFGFYFIVDQDMGVSDAIQESWRVTSTNWGAVIGIGLITTILNTIAPYLCCVGVFFVLPYTYLIWGSAYRQLVPGPDQPDQWSVGGPPSGYGAPPSGYGAPPSGYGAPPSGYGAPPSGYGAPPSGYGAPPSGH